MASSEAKRKLTAVFVTDVAAYSCLMGDDPEAALQTLAACSALERVEEARSEAREIHRINPRSSLQDFAERQPYKDQEIREKLVGELRKAGLT